MLGLWGASALVFSGMVGSGILILPSQMCAYGSWSIFSWIIGGFMAYSIAIIFERLSIHFKYKKNELVDFLEAVFGENYSFVISFGYYMAMATSSAVTSMALAGYLMPIFGIESLLFKKIIALSSLFGLLVLNFISFGAANSILIALTIAKLIFFCLISFLGLGYLDSYTFNFDSINFLFSGASLSMYAFLGVEFAVLSSGSIENPEKNVLKATKIGLFAATLIFLGVHCAVLFMIPFNMISSIPIFDVAAMLFGNIGAKFVSFIAVLSCLTTMNGTLVVQGNAIRNFANRNWIDKNFNSETSQGFPWKGALISIIISTLTIFNTTILNYALIITTSLVGMLYLSLVLCDIKLSNLNIYNFCALISSFLILYNLNLTIVLLMFIIYLVGYFIKINFKNGVKK